MSMRAEAYASDQAESWNALVAESRNGTFLHDRRYMDYHADRFQDCSVVFREDGRSVALLPANRSGTQAVSHQGLTFGGMISGPRMTAARVAAAFDALLEHFRVVGISELLYKPAPRIYQAMPADEDLYVLSRLGASLVRRDVSSVIDLANRPKPRDGRKSGAAKATRAEMEIVESGDWRGFWCLLESTLAARHDAKPVHSLAEIELLAARFPRNIRLFAAVRGGEMQGGTVIYETPLVARTQYIAAGDTGREQGALDLLFLTLLERHFTAKRYFDFGTSLDGEGALNSGLLDQKEGFGARAVVQDRYLLKF